MTSHGSLMHARHATVGHLPRANLLLRQLSADMVSLLKSWIGTRPPYWTGLNLTRHTFVGREPLHVILMHEGSHPGTAGVDAAILEPPGDAP